jgi:hypothetical protein
MLFSIKYDIKTIYVSIKNAITGIAVEKRAVTWMKKLISL